MRLSNRHIDFLIRKPFMCCYQLLNIKLCLIIPGPRRYVRTPRYSLVGSRPTYIFCFISNTLQRVLYLFVFSNRFYCPLASLVPFVYRCCPVWSAGAVPARGRVGRENIVCSCLNNCADEGSNSLTYIVCLSSRL